MAMHKTNVGRRWRREPVRLCLSAPALTSELAIAMDFNEIAAESQRNRNEIGQQTLTSD
jgi:hypothetical protein